MTVRDLKDLLDCYDDNDIVRSETRGDNYTSPSVYDNCYMDERDYESYYETEEEAIEAGVPKENIKRQVLVTRHT